MKNFQSIKINLIFAFTLTVLSAIMLAGWPQAACADGHRSHRGEFYDVRHGHNHYYPSRGHYIGVLPGGYRAFYHGRNRYYFHGGVWYRPYGSRFLIVAPPLGLVIPVLPPYYSTIWVRGVPYYYANDVYYVQSGNSYMVVSPPAGEVVQTPSQPVETPQQPETLYIYPRKGQSEKKQADDKYDCHSWAVSQTSYDPTRPPGDTPSAQKYADYKRAMSACLDARGYTVK